MKKHLPPRYRQGLWSILVFATLFTLAACKDLANDRSQAVPQRNPVSGIIETTTTIDPKKTTTPAVNEGGDVSGGGAGFEGEFKTITEELLKRMEKVGLYQLPLHDNAEKSLFTDEVRDLMKDVKISFVDRDLKKTVDGVEKDVDALNYPGQKLIEVNIPRWSAMKEKEAREHLVTHEIFGLAEVEKNVYDSSNKVLETLKRLENPKKPEDECSLEALGTHGGSACLWALSEVDGDAIKALEETFLKFSEPADKDDEYAKASKLKIKTYVETQRDNLQAQLDARCRGSSINEGNNAAYDGDLCDVKFLRERLKTMREFYNSVKERFPQIPYPRATEPFSG